MADREKIDFKDYVALIIAFLQTIFLPLIVFMIVVIIIVLLLSFIRPAGEIILLSLFQTCQKTA
ncbi:MAG: hypothetical protein QXW09_05315 [Thermoproteota archaeon]